MTDDELRRLAEAATPGPWIVDKTHPAFVVDARENDIAETGRLTEARGDFAQPFHNAAYIAAANPASVLALLDRLAEAERHYKAAMLKVMR